jgi:hypothetical protein
LELSFARTIHRFQGLQAGPVSPGKPQNMFPRVICDPDAKSSECRATGLFYTAISRATTLGDDDGLNSAIYFIGPFVTKERIQDLTQKTNIRSPFENVRKRSKWVSHLMSHLSIPPESTTSEMKEIFEWTTTQTITYDTLYTTTQRYIQSK